MTYLTAHRASSNKYGGNIPGQRPSQLPRPYRPDTRIPGAANDNFPRPANDNLRRPTPPRMPLTPKGMLVLKSLKSYSSALDVFGFKGTLEDTIIQRLVGAYTPQNMSGWILQNTCSGDPATHYNQASGFCAGPGSNGICYTGNLGAGNVPMGQPYSNIGCRLSLVRLTHHVLGVPRYKAISYWWRPTPFPRGAFRRPLPRTRPRPVIDPNDLPIRWFGPDPLPLPTVLVPHRVNDPIGSTRNNGDVKPRFVPRRPPEGPQVKEVKLRAASAAAAIVVPLQRIMHATTELLDHIDSFHEALPKKLQAKGGFVPGLGFRKATPQAKVKAVMANFRSLDWNEVIKNVIKNEIEDRTLGRANAGANKALNNAPGGRITRGFAF